MSKFMLIDAVHPEETRVALVKDGRVDDFDFEAAGKKQLRGNIYLAKVTRIEPSLQAAFVEYGGNRHGFLAFSEIHPDYYQLPQADREALLREAEELAAKESEDDEADDPSDIDPDSIPDEEDGDLILQEDEGESEEDSGSGTGYSDPDAEDASSKPPTVSQKEIEKKRLSLLRRYKIQEVIKRRQVMLIQVVKEERGNKGAAVTTYLSLAGRYCVLMPNTPRGGGISRKISSHSDRKRLKGIIKGFETPKGMGLIVRTAGAKRNKSDIRRDFDYLQKLWDNIRERTMNSYAPSLINEESGLVHRAMRDLYDKDIEEVLIQGPEAYREAKDLAKLLMPSQARKVKQWKDPSPLFAARKVEEQLNTIFSPTVPLPSGGYIVIDQTEALVAIDVNSGKSTRGKNIEQTATRTNLEAAEEACRQMRLRDLAGLIIIDFIDMEDKKNIRAVEKKMKDGLALDRARIHNGHISQFGLMELSRQRRRSGILEASSAPCEACEGTGRIRSIPSAALQLLRAIETRAANNSLLSLSVTAPAEVALYLLNHKRETVSQIEKTAGVDLSITSDSAILPGSFTLDATLDSSVKQRPSAQPLIEGDPDDQAFADSLEISEAEIDDAAGEAERPSDEAPKRTDRRRGRRKPSQKSVAPEAGSSDILEDAENEAASETQAAQGEEDDPRNGTDASLKRRRRRGRRGGRRNRRDFEESVTAIQAAKALISALALPSIQSKAPKGKDLPPEDGGALLDGLSLIVSQVLDEGLETLAPPRAEPPEVESETALEDIPPKPRRPRRKTSDKNAVKTAAPEKVEAEAQASAEATAPAPAPEEEALKAGDTQTDIEAPVPSEAQVEPTTADSNTADLATVETGPVDLMQAEQSEAEHVPAIPDESDPVAHTGSSSDQEADAPAEASVDMQDNQTSVTDLPSEPETNSFEPDEPSETEPKQGHFDPDMADIAPDIVDIAPDIGGTSMSPDPDIPVIPVSEPATGSSVLDIEREKPVLPVPERKAEPELQVEAEPEPTVEEEVAEPRSKRRGWWSRE